MTDTSNSQLSEEELYLQCPKCGHTCGVNEVMEHDENCPDVGHF